ncbi:MAG: Zn-ribbon domain-containing OB-fold protein [Thaumarchaeota archaeon]|nr:Zn-ribbon domain-containing OB-fold protein [Candidatus Calditenuaceae archaeon]MDW8186566.1 Zn-ribbon domain-containing OB-fold protein [Nitrososphaerota archaeon]
MTAKVLRYGSEQLEGLPEAFSELLKRATDEVSSGRESSWAKAVSEFNERVPDMSFTSLLVLPWLFDFRYRRSTGEAIARFLEGLKDARIIGTNCESCGRVFIPPRSFCEICFKRVRTFIEHNGFGEVATYSVAHIGTNPKEKLPRPEVVAVIWFEGTKVTRPNSNYVFHAGGLMHRLGEVEPSEVSIGMRVRPVWRSREQRRGDITDILYFAPVR